MKKSFEESSQDFPGGILGGTSEENFVDIIMLLVETPSERRGKLTFNLLRNIAT